MAAARKRAENPRWDTPEATKRQRAALLRFIESCPQPRLAHLYQVLVVDPAYQKPPKRQ